MMVTFRIDRHYNKGNAPGGHVIGDLAFACPIPCAAIQLRIGQEEVWLTRDEAMEVADALRNAVVDA
jgi:hypothetical protein